MKILEALDADTGSFNVSAKGLGTVFFVDTGFDFFETFAANSSNVFEVKDFFLTESFYVDAVNVTQLKCKILNLQESNIDNNLESAIFTRTEFSTDGGFHERYKEQLISKDEYYSYLTHSLTFWSDTKKRIEFKYLDSLVVVETCKNSGTVFSMKNSSETFINRLLKKGLKVKRAECASLAEFSFKFNALSMEV